MRKHRVVMACVTGLAALSLLAACGPTHKAAAPAPKQLIYFIFPGFTTMPYFAPMAAGIKQAAKDYPQLDIKVVSANNSSATEITDVKEAIAAGAKGIILTPISGTLTSVAQEAMSKHVPVITIDRDVTSPAARVAFIGDKDVVLGQDETTYALSYLAAHHVPKPWHVAILQGTLGSSTAIDRLNGAQQALAPYVKDGQAQVVFNQSANFATSTAETMMSEELAKDSNIQLVICGNDAMALGAILAAKDRGLTPGKQIFVVGADAQPQSLADVKTGQQLDTVTHSPYVEAVWAVEAMSNYLHGVQPPSAKFPHGDITIPMTVVTKANVSKIAGWGTPQTVPPLPYGQGKAVPTT
ncbi:MAG: sugar ABC transporter substrate-binding protein [Thermaerobacter sp.]|nr:sugar ABC transporter substrate-binding protein [Thermaerobacter sp.]